MGPVWLVDHLFRWWRLDWRGKGGEGERRREKRGGAVFGLGKQKNTFGFFHFPLGRGGGSK
jgi:hypothetical protein